MLYQTVAHPHGVWLVFDREAMTVSQTQNIATRGGTLEHSTLYICGDYNTKLLLNHLILGQRFYTADQLPRCDLLKVKEQQIVHRRHKLTVSPLNVQEFPGHEAPRISCHYN